MIDDQVLIDVKLNGDSIKIKFESIENNPVAANKAAKILYNKIRQILATVKDARVVESSEQN
ncbi:MAG: hypothetical protein AAF383_19790 [Cyanobacteria bacterium P01_A01_bin.83]